MPSLLSERQNLQEFPKNMEISLKVEALIQKRNQYSHAFIRELWCSKDDCALRRAIASFRCLFLVVRAVVRRVACISIALRAAPPKK